MKVGIIGATGWLGSILGKRLLDSGRVAPEDLVVLTRGAPGTSYAGHAGVRWARDAGDLASECDIIVASVRPHDWEAVALSAPGCLLISFMAGIALSQLAATGARCARAMPNAAAALGLSFTPWMGDQSITPQDAGITEQILSVIGRVERLQNEAHLDLMAAVPGSGAAYPALLADAMLRYLVDAGVAPDLAARAVEGVVCDAAQLLAGRVSDAAQVVREYRDYRGMTADGLDAADAAGFSASIRAALDAAVARSGQLAQSATGVRI